MGTFEVSPITTALISPPNAFLNGRGMVALQSGLEVTHHPWHTKGFLCFVLLQKKKKKDAPSDSLGVFKGLLS